MEIPPYKKTQVLELIETPGERSSADVLVCWDLGGEWELRTSRFCQIIPRDLSTKRSVLHGREGWAVFQTLSIYGNWARPPLIASTILCWCAVMRLLCRLHHFYGCVNIHSYQGTLVIKYLEVDLFIKGSTFQLVTTPMWALPK